MILKVSVLVDDKKVHEKTKKISMVSDATSAVLKVLDAAPDIVMEWTSIKMEIIRE